MKIKISILIILISICALACEKFTKNDVRIRNINGDFVALINLDRPGAMNKLKNTTPEHYERIKNILYGISSGEIKNIKEWLKVDYDAIDPTVSKYFWKTSYPPKHTVAFTFDEFRYQLTITDWSYSAGAILLD